MKNWDIEFLNRALNCETYRDFLSLFFTTSKIPRSNPKKISFQKFSTLAGYSSKSYPAEIMSGKKSLQISSLDKFAKGLNLNQNLTLFLTHLIQIEDILNEIKLEKNESNKKILNSKLLEIVNSNINLKSKIYKNFNSKESNDKFLKSNLSSVILQKNFPEVYCSMGSVDDGASLDDIKNRSGLPEKIILKIIEQLIKENLILSRDDRFFVVENSLDLNFLNTDEYFKYDFMRSLEKIKNKFDHQSKSHEALFLTQTFSVKKSRLLELRNKLIQTISEYSEDYEDSNGDTIGEICLSLTSSI